MSNTPSLGLIQAIAEDGTPIRTKGGPFGPTPTAEKHRWYEIDDQPTPGEPGYGSPFTHVITATSPPPYMRDAA